MSKKKPRVGILTFGDGREFLSEPLRPVNEKFTNMLRTALEADGFEVVVGNEVIWQNQLAEKNGRKLAAAGVECTIFLYAVWAWPQYTRVAAQFCPQPILMFSAVNPQYPGLVGMLAAAGSLDQVGIPFHKTFGELSDEGVFNRLRTRILAVAAHNRLRGKTYALIGGRSLGIDTAVADAALWMKKFGIDVDHVDQMELVRRAEEHVQSGDRVNAAFEYLGKHVRKIHWTKPDATMRLTPDLLRRQLGMYYAAIDLANEFNYEFCGIKGQRELTEHYATADIAEAFLNDEYGPAGEPHAPIICSTEADMDAALTMLVFHYLSGTPVLFADVRHYDAERNVWDLCNSGEHATYFAAKSSDPAANLAKTEFRPQGFYFPAGGASVYHIAEPGPVTLARLTRSGDTNQYRMAVVRGQFVRFGDEQDERLACSIQDNWPHAFARLACSPEAFVNGMHCNHIHGVYGDYVEELSIFCETAGVRFDLLM
ncbi:MAG: L-fucose/L-arabinose isomerase family protein [Phycisphaerales bacterium]|nr:L-fucose/L-arabinose isomerase family protein [Phycisphaerales bacterium]MCB9863173.1 L-fucose/L-arabinose isomerase family protein [Phycisphaerales bacterium]